MSTKLTEAEVREMFGDLEERARELEAFSRGARIFSAHYDRLTADYDDKWIAIHEDDADADNVVSADSPEELTAALEKHDVREGECHVRFVSRPKGRLIL